MFIRFKSRIALLLVAIRNSIRGLCNKTSIGSAFLAIIMQECCTVEARPTSDPLNTFAFNYLRNFVSN